MQSIILVSLVLLASISSFVNGQSFFTVSNATLTYVYNEGPGESNTIELSGIEDSSKQKQTARFYVEDTDDGHITIEGHCGEPFCKYDGMVNTNGVTDVDGHYLDCCFIRHSPGKPSLPAGTVIRMYDASHSNRIDFNITTQTYRCGDTSSWDNSGTCEYCGCDLKGSTSTGCDGAGVCKCAPDHIGDKCDSCAVGNFRTSTDKNCTVCVCVTANVDATVCNGTTGMCNCASSYLGMNCCFKYVAVDGEVKTTVSGIESFYDCHAECQENSSCNYFTYFTKDHTTKPKECELKSEEGSETKGTLNLKTNISGPKDCPLPTNGKS